MAEIYVPGAIDIMGSANQMMQFRNSQQAQQANALQMQYTMEDRAREAENRKIAAGNALAARAEAQKIAKIYEQGFNPGQTALMTPSIAPGPGVVRKAAEPSYDYTKTALEFLRIGKTDKAKELFGLPEARREANAKGIEGDAKAQLAVLETSAKTYTTALERVKSVLDQAISIDGLLHYVDVVDADDVLGPLAIKTGGPTEARKEAIRKMAAPKEAGGGGMTVDQIAKRLSGVSGYDLAGLDIDFKAKQATIDQTNAAALKARSEAGTSKAGVFGDTNEGRQLQIVNEVLKGTRLPSDPEYALAFDALYAGKSIPAYNPETKQMELVKAPATAPANLPPPTLGKTSAATPPITMSSVASNLRPSTNALSTMNGALRPPVQANALAASPDAPIITKAPTGGLTEAQKIKIKGDTSKDYAIATETLRSIQDVTRVVDKLEKADISGVTGYRSLMPSFTEESTIAQSNIEGLKAKMTALAKVMSAATGKLGNLAVQEYQLLQNQIDTFDPYLGEVATRDQLSNIKNTMKRIEFVVRDVYSKEYGGEDNPFAQFRALPTDVGGEANNAGQPSNGATNKTNTGVTWSLKE